MRSPRSAGTINGPKKRLTELLRLAMNVTPPRTYVERFPRRGAWTPAAEPPPPFSFTTQLLLPNGETTSGVWTGALWWRAGQEIKPLGWR